MAKMKSDTPEPQVIEGKSEFTPANMGKMDVPATAPAPQKPSVCRMVLYRLATRDVMRIRNMAVAGIPHTASNAHAEGQAMPAVIVKVNEDRNGEVTCNLKVMVDGQVPDLWLQNIACGEERGQWNWPGRV